MDRGRGEVWVAVQAVLLAVIALIPPRLGGVLPAWPAALAQVALVAGLVFGALAALVLVAGALHLGAGNLTVFPRPRADGSLVQGGLYGIVRHPIYLGVLLAALAWGLLRASLPALLLTAGLALFFDAKARREEQWLLDHYPDYADYRRRVRGRIFPGIG